MVVFGSSELWSSQLFRSSNLWIIISISLVILVFFFSKLIMNSEALAGTMYGGVIAEKAWWNGGHRGSNKTRGVHRTGHCLITKEFNNILMVNAIQIWWLSYSLTLYGEKVLGRNQFSIDTVLFLICEMWVKMLLIFILHQNPKFWKKKFFWKFY